MMWRQIAARQAECEGCSRPALARISFLRTDVLRRHARVQPRRHGGEVQQGAREAAQLRRDAGAREDAQRRLPQARAPCIPAGFESTLLTAMLRQAPLLAALRLCVPLDNKPSTSICRHQAEGHMMHRTQRQRSLHT